MCTFDMAGRAEGPKERPPPERRSQHTLSRSGPLTRRGLHPPYSTIPPPASAVLAPAGLRQPGEFHPDKHAPRTGGGGGVGGGNAPESPPHLSPPRSRRTLPSSSERWGRICRQTSGRCPSSVMPQAGTSKRPILPSQHLGEEMTGMWKEWLNEGRRREGRHPESHCSWD